MQHIESFFATISDDPLTSAFEEEKKTMPPAGAARMRPPVSTWEGGTFEDFAEEAYLSMPDRPLSIYVHVPFCHHHCTFCPFYINQTKKDFSTEYTKLILKEIAHTAYILRNVIHQRTVEVVYFGGGTPSDLEKEDMSRIIRTLYDTFRIAKGAEVTVEGRIRGFTPDKGKEWVRAGANRFSLGVQTTDTVLRKRLGRLSDREEVRDHLNGLCETDASVVIDLMYGFPDQTKEMLLEDIRFVSEETGIHGLDLYEMRRFPESPLDKAIKKGKMSEPPSFLEKARMFGAAYESLVSYSYEQFAPRHWRRNPIERSLYNRMARAQTDMIPFGSGAGGRLGEIGIGNTGNLQEYTEKVLRDEKPVGRISHSPLKGTKPDFSQCLGEALEELRIPALSRWPETHREPGKILLDQWRQAGLLSGDEDETGIGLTPAGHFWTMRMRQLLVNFVSEPVQ